jgi:hypothetical protein
MSAILRTFTAAFCPCSNNLLCREAKRRFAARAVGVALIPQSASRFQRPSVLFKPLTDILNRVETDFFVRKSQMRSSVKDLTALTEIAQSLA